MTGAATKIPAPFRVDSVRYGTTVRVHSVNRIEVNMDLGFGVHISRLFTLDCVVSSDIDHSRKHDAVRCLVVLLGGKKVIVQPENEKPTCTFARIFLNEKIYGSPIGLVTNVAKLDRPILDVTPFFLHLAENDFDVQLVYEVVNRQGKD